MPEPKVKLPEPKAKFSYTDDGAFTFTFTNESANAENYRWDFGDGDISEEEFPIHIYNLSGDYTVVLTAIKDGKEHSFSLELSVVSIPMPPEPALSLKAKFSYTDNGVFTFTFANESTNAENYLWDFGDGNTSREESIVHAYASHGEYTVVLTVTDSSGEDTASKDIVVACADTSIRRYSLEWNARPETAVNQEEGGYRICYGTSENFKIILTNCTQVSYNEVTGTPTSAMVEVGACYSHLKIQAFSRLNLVYAAEAMVSLPED